MLRIYDDHEIQQRLRLRRLTVIGLLGLGVVLGLIGSAGAPELRGEHRLPVYVGEPSQSAVSQPAKGMEVDLHCLGGKPAALKMDCRLSAPN